MEAWVLLLVLKTVLRFNHTIILVLLPLTKGIAFYSVKFVKVLGFDNVDVFIQRKA